MRRRLCRLALLAVALTAQAVYAADSVPYSTLPNDPLRWYDAKNLGVEGRGWSDVKEFYDRLPSKAESVVRPPVWGLSRNSSGICVRFEADTPSIAVRWILRSPKLELPHMAGTGVSGVDLYGRTADGVWRWIAVGRPEAVENKQTLAGSLPPGKREYMVYLPLYNGVTTVEIGLPPEASMERSTNVAAKRKPIVFYGTSIMQGACASRPGMTHSAILGRRLDVPIINLGFSGNGKMEPEVAALLAELDPSIYVIDALPNMTADEVAARAEPLVLALRKARPNVPIVLVEDRTYADASWNKSRLDRNLTSRVALRAAYERLVGQGVAGLTYVGGNQLLRADGEDTVDGSHPTDLGFMRHADVLEPVLKPLLEK